MIAVIMAGGKGTRIQSINNKIHKPMIQVCGKPILEHQIIKLKENGINNIIIVIGYLGNVIKKYFGDGSKWNISVKYVEEEKTLGTAGALYFIKNMVSDDFLMLNGDIIFDINFNNFYNFHKDKGGIATLFTHPNDHPYDSSIIVYNDKKRIIKWYNKEDNHKDVKNCVNAGIHLFNTNIFEYFTILKKTDLDREILRPLLLKKCIYAYTSPEYVKDMGTPDRYKQVVEDVNSGIVRKKNLSNKQKAIFLDRDGTLNKYKGFITQVDDIELTDDAAETVKMINKSEYLAIVITNQPVIARGDCTIEELVRIHNRLEMLLGEKGAYLDAIYYCPHHIDKGFKGEIPELKYECECRKPKPGMLYKAAKDLNIDISESYMFGDSDIDVETGKNAGCKDSFIIKNNLYDLVKNCVNKII